MEEDKVKEEKGEELIEETDAVELVLFQVSECYVYMIPPRISAASYRADEWNVNKWAWEGILKVVSKGVECIIRLEDKTTGELYARAFLRDGEPHPVEAVIDSSRYFVLRVEEDIGGRLRHAFIGIGFRERSEAYDFQAALHDHMKYLNKKKTAEEMEHQYQHSSSVDYSLKDGETLVLQLKKKDGGSTRSKFFEQRLSNLSLEDKSNHKQSPVSIKLPPPPPPPLSPVDTTERSPLGITPKSSPDSSSPENKASSEMAKAQSEASENKEQYAAAAAAAAADDDFGDFQAASVGVTAGKAAGMNVVAVPSLQSESDSYSIADTILHSLLEFQPEQWGLPPFEDWIGNALPIEPFHLTGVFSNGLLQANADDGKKVLPVQTWGLYIGWAKLDGQKILKAVIRIYCCGSEKKIQPCLIDGDYVDDSKIQLLLVGYLRRSFSEGYTWSCPDIVDDDKLSAGVALDLPSFSHKFCDSKFLGES